MNKWGEHVFWEHFLKESRCQDFLLDQIRFFKKFFNDFQSLYRKYRKFSTIFAVENLQLQTEMLSTFLKDIQSYKRRFFTNIIEGFLF